MRRLAVLLLDGLRPDAVSLAPMPSFEALGRDWVRAANARTIRPSVTVAALASLATGVSPTTHGLIEPGLGFLGRLNGLRPVARELARHGMPTAVVTRHLGRVATAVAATLTGAAGISRFASHGRTAREAALHAREVFEAMDAGLLIVYLPDCDRAGHRHGWMSAPYLRAAADLDAAVGLFATGLGNGTLIALADHGGGGVTARGHDEPHATNDWIPLVIAGRGVRRQRVLGEPVSLLDLPPTILWRLGVPVPPCYEGQVLRDAFLHPTLAPGGAAA
jgi:arylsulfatase A-like enzyme